MLRQVLSLALFLLLAKQSSANQTLTNLPANSWYEAPNTTMRPVCPPRDFSTRSNCSRVIRCWNSAVYDTKHHHMIVFGGGHNDYHGNEVYTFDVNTMKWERLTDPSPGPYNQDPLNDGNPVSVHTYDGLSYMTHIDRFFCYGGSRATDGRGTGKVTWLFDTENRKWHNMGLNGDIIGGSAAYIHLTSEYDPKTQKVYFQAKGGTFSWEYESKQWTRLNGRGAPGGDKMTSIDTKRDLLFTVGDGNWVVYDIQKDQDVTTEWAGAKPSYFSDICPGFTYNSKADEFVAWKGGNTVYIFDPAAKKWSTKTASGYPGGTPWAGGVYGRFRYIPEYNVCIMIHGADSNVFFYKHTSGSAGSLTAGNVKKNDPELNVFPNPFNTAITLRVQCKGQNANCKMQIYNTHGRLITRLDGTRLIDNQAVFKWNTKGMTPGIYFARMKFGNTVLSRRLFLVK
jgi:hypothetical protein